MELVSTTESVVEETQVAAEVAPEIVEVATETSDFKFDVSEVGETTATENTEITTETVAEADIFAPLKTKFSREDLDEDYLTKNYRQLLKEEADAKASIQKELLEFKSKQEISEAAVELDKFVKAGGNPIDFFKAQTVDIKTIPEDQKLFDYLKRNNPLYTDDIIKHKIKTEYGLSPEIEGFKDSEYIDEQNKYFDALTKRIDAVAAQDKFLEDSKIKLTTPPQASEVQTQVEEIDYHALVAEYQTKLLQNIGTGREISVGDMKFKMDDAGRDGLVPHFLSNQEGVLMLTGVDEKEVFDALALWRGKDAVFNAIKKEANVTAEIRNDELHNNAAEVRKSGDASSDQKGWEIKVA